MATSLTNSDLTTRAELTNLQLAIVDFFREAMVNGLPPPTLRELCVHFGWRSTATARDHLNALARKGALESHGGARGYRLGWVPTSRAIPLIGSTVQANRPLVESRIGEVMITEPWARLRNLFAFHAAKSTVAGILRGDIVIARTSTVADGEIIVVCHRETLVLRHVRRKRGPKPKNVVGVVVGLMRDLQPGKR